VVHRLRMSLAADDLPRHRCLRCRRPPAVCWCDALAPIANPTHVVFLQHPREARVPVSTCRMAHLSLANSQMHVAWSPDDLPGLAERLAGPDTYILFPSADATEVGALTRTPRTLVVVDGTWSNAKKLVRRSPLLRGLPGLVCRPEFVSRYRIRREPALHCLSTIEATAHALEHIERAPGRYAPILRAFERMVDVQLDYVGRRAGAMRHGLRHPTAAFPDPLTDHLAPLRAALDRLVLLDVEANADEPIQLSALRPATGRRFTALLAPRGPLAPRTALHLGRDPAELAAGLSLARAQAAWRDYLGDAAVLGVWGYHGLNLLRGEPGWTLAPALDLRALRMQVRGRVGGFPEGPGRAERRLDALAALLADLRGSMD
jgi:DTW domain-containing protein YfiP